MAVSVPPIIAHRRRRSTHRPTVSRIPWLTILTAVSFIAGVTIAAVAGPDVRALLAVLAIGYLVALTVHMVAARFDGIDA